MQIHGFQKTTLLDYPEHLAATVFTGGCNFRCPFCHNGDLVLAPASVPLIDEADVFAHLTKRQGLLDGVCITGGEPTLQPDLEAFIHRIRALDYKIKLDTNGYRPEVLMHLCEQGLIDYVAMDIKHSAARYNEICQVKNFDFSKIQASIDYLRQGHVPYEFRTTLVAELHNIEDIRSIGQLISDCSHYYLQAYTDSEQVIMPGYHAPSRDDLLTYKKELEKTIKKVTIRGVD